MRITQHKAVFIRQGATDHVSVALTSVRSSQSLIRSSGCDGQADITRNDRSSIRASRCQRTSQNPCGRTDGSRRRTSNPCRRTARFPFGGQCSHAATGKTMLPRRFRCSGRRRPCAPDRLATGRRGSACVHAPGSPGTERSMAVSSSDPFWLLCAIRRVMSAERDFLVSTDKPFQAS